MHIKELSNSLPQKRTPSRMQESPFFPSCWPKCFAPRHSYGPTLRWGLLSLWGAKIIHVRTRVEESKATFTHWFTCWARSTTGLSQAMVKQGPVFPSSTLHEAWCHLSARGFEFESLRGSFRKSSRNNNKWLQYDQNRCVAPYIMHELLYVHPKTNEFIVWEEKHWQVFILAICGKRGSWQEWGPKLCHFRKA